MRHMICMSSSMTPTISENAKSNIDEIELDAISSSAYFKPPPSTTYVIRVDIDKHKIKPVENERFKDAQGKPLKRYEFVIAHVNNQKEQVWTVSKRRFSQLQLCPEPDQSRCRRAGLWTRRRISKLSTNES